MAKIEAAAAAKAEARPALDAKALAKAKSMIEAAVGAKAEARPARDAKAQAKTKAKTKAAAAAKAERPRPRLTTTSLRSPMA